MAQEYVLAVRGGIGGTRRIPLDSGRIRVTRADGSSFLVANSPDVDPPLGFLPILRSSGSTSLVPFSLISIGSSYQTLLEILLAWADLQLGTTPYRLQGQPTEDLDGTLWVEYLVDFQGGILDSFGNGIGIRRWGEIIYRIHVPAGSGTGEADFILSSLGQGLNTSYRGVRFRQGYFGSRGREDSWFVIEYYVPWTFVEENEVPVLPSPNTFESVYTSLETVRELILDAASSAGLSMIVENELQEDVDIDVAHGVLAIELGESGASENAIQSGGRTLGTAMIQVYFPLEQGLGEALALADAVIQSLTAVNTLGTRIGVPYITGLTTEDGWAQFSLLAPLQLDELLSG